MARGYRPNWEISRNFQGELNQPANSSAIYPAWIHLVQLTPAKGIIGIDSAR